MGTIIDIHTHVFPDEVASRAVSLLGQTSGIQPSLDGTTTALRKSMRTAGINRCALMPIATKLQQVARINQWIAGLDREYFIPFGTIYPPAGDFDGQINQILELNLPGIKLHPDYQDFYPDDESVFPLYDILQKNGLIVLMHCGRDPSFEGIHTPPHSIRRIIDTFPDLILIAAHFGGYQVWDDVERYLIGTPVFLETSYTLPFLAADRFVAMARAHGIERVLFGTDSPWTDQREEIDKIKACGLSKDERERIFHLNAETHFNF